MMRAVAWVSGVALAALSLSSAMAQNAPAASASAPIVPERLAACLIEQSTPEIEEAMRLMMIAALQRNRAEAQQQAMAFGMTLVTVATGQCGVGFDQLQSPEFAAAAQVYGTSVGQRLMTEALQPG